MIQAEEFLRLAEIYATGKSEADWRSAVSLAQTMTSTDGETASGPLREETAQRSSFRSFAGNSNLSVRSPAR